MSAESVLATGHLSQPLAGKRTIPQTQDHMSSKASSLLQVDLVRSLNVILNVTTAKPLNCATRGSRRIVASILNSFPSSDGIAFVVKKCRDVSFRQVSEAGPQHVMKFGDWRADI